MVPAKQIDRQTRHLKNIIAYDVGDNKGHKF